MNLKRIILFFFLSLFFSKALFSTVQHDSIYPMGKIGGSMKLDWKRNQLIVIELMSNGPGDQAGLRVNDRIISAGYDKFKEIGTSPDDGAKGALEGLGNALDKTDDVGELELVVLRNNKKIDLIVKFEKTKRFSNTFPMNCERSKFILRKSLNDIIEVQNNRGDGKIINFNTTTAFAGLALLSIGDNKYKKSIDKIVNYYVNGKFSIKDTKHVCELSYSGIFLSEYHLMTGDNKVLPVIKGILIKLLNGISPVNSSRPGLVGHHADYREMSYSGRGLNIAGSAAFWCFAIASKCGVKVGEQKVNLLKKVLFKNTATRGDYVGMIAYGYNDNGLADSQSSGRTAQTLMGLYYFGNEPKKLKYYSDVLNENHKLFMSCHTTTFLSMVSGMFAMAATNQKAFQEAMKSYRWFFALSQDPRETRYVGSIWSWGLFGDGQLNGIGVSKMVEIGENKLMPILVALLLGLGQEKLSLNGSYPIIQGITRSELPRDLKTAYDSMRDKELSKATKILEKYIIKKNKPNISTQNYDEKPSGLAALALAKAKVKGNQNQSQGEEEKKAKLLWEYIINNGLKDEYEKIKRAKDKSDPILVERLVRKFNNKYGKLKTYETREYSKWVISKENKNDILPGRLYYACIDALEAKPDVAKRGLSRLIEKKQYSESIYIKMAKEMIEKL